MPASGKVGFLGAALQWVLLLAGLCLTFCGAYWIGLGRAYLGGPWLTNAEYMDETTAPNNVWAIMTLLMALGFALFAGPRRWVPWIDSAAIFGAFWVAFWLVVLAPVRYMFEFADPERQCVREDCWPQGWLEVAVSAPGLLTCLVTLSMATVGRNARRWVRAFVPAVVFIALTITQLLVWDTYAIPFFSGPRPW